MAFVAVEGSGVEMIFTKKPYRAMDGMRVWCKDFYSDCVVLPKGSIAKLIGRGLTWEDEPVELKD